MQITFIKKKYKKKKNKKKKKKKKQKQKKTLAGFTGCADKSMAGLYETTTATTMTKDNELEMHEIRDIRNQS